MRKILFFVFYALFFLNAAYANQYNAPAPISTVHAYPRALYVDFTNGSDTSGNGAYEKPFLTISKALTVAGSSGYTIYLMQGTNSENLTISNQNLDIVGMSGARSGNVQLSGTIAVANTASSVRISNISFNNTVTLSASGSVYLYNINSTSFASFVKSGTGFVFFQNSDISSSPNFTVSAGSISVYTTNITGLNQSAGTFGSYAGSSLIAPSFSGGTTFLGETTIYALTSGGTAFTQSGTNIALFRDVSCLDSAGAIAKISLGGLAYTASNFGYLSTGSTITATNSNSYSYFDAMNVKNYVLANNEALSVTTTISSATPTAMTSLSSRNQRITGTISQIVRLPDETAIPTGASYFFANDSTGDLRIQDFNGNLLLTVPLGGQVDFVSTANSSVIGNWKYSSRIVGGVSTGVTGLGLAVLATSPSVTTPAINGITYSGSGTTGQILTLTGATTATWANMATTTGINNTTTSSTTVSLNATSPLTQRFTGSTAQIIKLPDETTILAGNVYTIINDSSAILTVQDSAGSNLTTILSGTTTNFVSTSNATATFNWTIEKLGSSSTGNGISQWLLANSYTSGQVVINNGALFVANGAINANTAFAVGQSGSTWSPITQSQYSLTVANLGSGGAIATQSQLTAYSVLSVVQTTSGQTMTLPTPIGGQNIIYVYNSGTTTFTMYSVLINVGSIAELFYNGSIWLVKSPVGVTNNLVTSSSFTYPNSTTQPSLLGSNMNLEAALGSLQNQILGGTTRATSPTTIQSSTSSSPFKVWFGIGNPGSFDTSGAFDTTNNRYVAKRAGYYNVSIYMQVNATLPSSMYFNGFIYKNGSQYSMLFSNGSSIGSYSSGNGSDLIYLSANDYIEIYVMFGGNNGTSYSLVNNGTCYFNINYLHQ
jgi:hypothetical protein